MTTLQLFDILIEYSKVYELNFQMWPNNNSIYISKDGVDLTSYGGYDEVGEVMIETIKYLDRINNYPSRFDKL